MEVIMAICMRFVSSSPPACQATGSAIADPLSSTTRTGSHQRWPGARGLAGAGREALEADTAGPIFTWLDMSQSP
jgi:hypothetical protein